MILNLESNCWIIWQSYASCFVEPSNCFNSSYTILYFHQQCTSILIFSHFHQHVLFSTFSVIKIRNITVNMSGNSLILISLMTNFVEHLFMHLLVLLCILWRNNYSNYLPIFQVTCPLSLSCSLYILLFESLSGIRLVSIFSNTISCAFWL